MIRIESPHLAIDAKGLLDLLLFTVVKSGRTNKLCTIGIALSIQRLSVLIVGDLEALSLSINKDGGHQNFVDCIELNPEAMLLVLLVFLAPADKLLVSLRICNVSSLSCTQLITYHEGHVSIGVVDDPR